MRLRILLPALLTAAIAGCNNVLDVKPTSTIPEETAINSPQNARAALVGAYQVLQSGSYYGQDFTLFGDISSDNAAFSGTRTEFAEADQNQLRADNGSITGMWEKLYEGINRANEILTKVPNVQGLDDTERNEILGEAHFLRALHYHNLVKLWGGVPIVLEPTSSLPDASQVSRASVPDVYTQILADLDAAASLITNGDITSTYSANLGVVEALRARVLLYMGDYTGAEAAAKQVEDMGYSLAGNYADLFDQNGAATSEDIFRIVFTPQQYNNISYEYFTRGLGGLYQQKPTLSMQQAYWPATSAADPKGTYTPTDVRGIWNINYQGSRVYGSKFRSSGGTEHLHVIRLAEVILIRAEALARLNQLQAAVDEMNLVRERAQVPDYVLGAHTQAEVIAAIADERRRELAFEGDRWPDMVRLGIATTVLGIDPNMTLYPIPQRELDVLPNLSQNPGY